MAGFQQAANALTGAYGTIAGRVGIYNEMVGKNQKLIKELEGKNEELEGKNEELAQKNEELAQKNEEIRDQYETMDAQAGLISAMETEIGERELYEMERNEAFEKAKKAVINLRNRAISIIKSRESKKAMLDALYQKPTEETPFFKKESKGGK